MIAYDLFFIHGKEPVRIIVFEVCFICKRQLFQIFKSPDVFRLNSRCIHLFPIRLHTVVNIF